MKRFLISDVFKNDDDVIIVCMHIVFPFFCDSIVGCVNPRAICMNWGGKKKHELKRNVSRPFSIIAHIIFTRSFWFIRFEQYRLTNLADMKVIQFKRKPLIYYWVAGAINKVKWLNHRDRNGIPVKPTNGIFGSRMESIWNEEKKKKVNVCVFHFYWFLHNFHWVKRRLVELNYEAVWETHK